MAHMALALKSHSPKSNSAARSLREAESLFIAGDSEQAERLFQQILEVEPNHSEALNNMGVLAHQRGQREGAIAYFTRALQSDLHNRDAVQNLSELLAAMNSAEIVSVGRYAFPSILCRLASGQWGKDDTDFLKKAVGTLTSANRSRLLSEFL